MFIYNGKMGLAEMIKAEKNLMEPDYPKCGKCSIKKMIAYVSRFFNCDLID